MTTWNIKANHAGERLDLFLLAKKPALSRTAIQKLIKAGNVVVNDKPATVHRFLKVGDKVKWESNAKRVAANAKPSPDKPGELKTISYKLKAPHIIAETADWLVIDKPAGLLVHADSKTKTGTLVDWLMAHDPKIGRIGEEPERPGIIHRLDRDVSGLMAVAKTQLAYDELKKQFAGREVEKKYLALVYGRMLHDEGDIKFRIARSTSQARMAARPKEQAEGKAAWTHYRVLQRWPHATLVELTILSGRTHQIRAHLHALGHAIVGDPLYKTRGSHHNFKSSRLMLQSVKLAFQDPRTNAPQSFELPPDPAFAALTSTL